MRRTVVALSAFVAALVIVACGGAGGPLTPAAPTGLVGVAANGQAVLSWNISSGATHYNVKRSTQNGGPYTLIAGPNLPAYTDTGLTNGTTYYYVVSADSPLGESENSTQVAVTPSGPATVDVSILSNFTPVTVNAVPGQTVRWTNNDFGTHTVTGDTSPGPDSSTAHPGGLAPNDTYTWTVPINATSGQKFFYHCNFHGAAGNGSSLGSGMAGCVQVP